MTQPRSNQQRVRLTDIRRLYSSSRCLLEAMKSPPFWIQPVWRPVSSSRSLLTTFLVWPRSSTSTSLGRSCHRRPEGVHAETQSKRTIETLEIVSHFRDVILILTAEANANANTNGWKPPRTSDGGRDTCGGT